MMKAFKWGKFSDKALFSIRDSDAFINIWHGAVRSSKTVNSLIRWLAFLKKSKADEFMVSGKTERTLYRNVLKPLFSMIHPLRYHHDKYEGILRILDKDLRDKEIYLVGMNDEKITNKIKGMTIGGWMGDEITTAPKSAVEMAISRCSEENGKIFWTTNTDSPYHYIYTDYITNEELLRDKTVKVYHFLIRDNPNLPESYVKNLKKIYPPGTIWHKRYIAGLWVLAEGAIYDMFIEGKHTFGNGLGGNYSDYFVAVDYATASVCVFGLFGYKKGRYDLIREWYWDAEKEGKQMTDVEYSEMMSTFTAGFDYSNIYCPHDASSFIKQLQTDGFRVVKVVGNVSDGIKRIQNLLYNDKFRIQLDCVNSVQQAQTYVWDKKAQERGEDKPLKQNDHCPDMWRYGVMGHGGTAAAYSISKSKYDFARARSEWRG